MASLLTGALGASVDLLIGLDALLQKGIKDVASAFDLEEETIQNYIKRSLK